MAYRGTYFVADQFDGGFCGNLPAADLSLNQAADLDNVIIGSDGKSFRTTWPTVRINATEFGTDTLPVIGVGYLLKSTGTDYLLAIRGGAAYGTTLNAAVAYRDLNTFADRTGAVTVKTTTSQAGDIQAYRYSFCTFNDKLIGFGGALGDYGTPFTWDGEPNDIVALAGSPPSAAFGFSANNRVFACKTTSEPSTIFWSVLGDEADWTGTGSGSAVVGSLDDGEPILAATVLANQICLIFKRNSIHQMNLSSAPFGNYLLFGGVGACSQNAVVTVDGEAYFLSSDGRMRSTDGNRLKQYPDSHLSIFTDPNPFYAQALRADNWVSGYRYSGPDCDLIVWSIIPSGLNLNPLALIWDLRNECWLKCSTGFGFVCAARSVGNVTYGGSYNTGHVFNPDVAGFGINDTDGTTTVTSFWRTGWLSQKALNKLNQIRRVGLNLNTRPVSLPGTGLVGSWTISYGYNFEPDTNTATISAEPDGVEDQTFRFIIPVGRGISIQFKFEWTGTDQNSMAAGINSILFAGKSGGQARISAT